MAQLLRERRGVLLEETLLQKMEYIHANPVKCGYVERAEDCEFSSAAWYARGVGPISIDWFDD